MFHAKNGWFFQRIENGAVQIIKRTEAKNDSFEVASVIVAPEEWASIVASVSVNGENNGRFYEALDFHMGTKL